MDKALEVIMVAMILVVASVVILALLQNQTGSFGSFVGGQTNSSGCGLLELKYERNIQCNPDSETPAASAAETEASSKGCQWASSSVSASNYCS